MVIFRGFEVGGGGYIGKMLYLCRLLGQKGLVVDRKCSYG